MESPAPGLPVQLPMHGPCRHGGHWENKVPAAELASWSVAREESGNSSQLGQGRGSGLLGPYLGLCRSQFWASGVR